VAAPLGVSSASAQTSAYAVSRAATTCSHHAASSNAQRRSAYRQRAGPSLSRRGKRVELCAFASLRLWTEAAGAAWLAFLSLSGSGVGPGSHPGAGLHPATRVIPRTHARVGCPSCAPQLAPTRARRRVSCRIRGGIRCLVGRAWRGRQDRRPAHASGARGIRASRTGLLISCASRARPTGRADRRSRAAAPRCAGIPRYPCPWW